MHQRRRNSVCTGTRRRKLKWQVRNFLSTWQRRAPGRVVHIVTGKGRRSAGEPVLQRAVVRLLSGTLKHLTDEFSKDLDGVGYLVRPR